MTVTSVGGSRNHAEPLVALVTGANRGIGLEIARGLKERGVTVVRTARTAEKNFIELNVRDRAQVERVRERIETIYGALDILINNAGSGVPTDADASLVDLSAVVQALENNCFGAILMIQALLPALRRSGRGRIINVSSGMASFSGTRYDNTAYRLSKACLNAYTAIVARELLAQTVTVNAMCPGHARTRMGGIAAPLSAAEAADTAVWLALDAPATVSGRFFRNRREIPW